MHAGDWPQWRGANRDGHAANDERSLSDLPREPKVSWKLEIGGGFSSPVVSGTNLIYLDAQDDKEVAHALNALDGKELWRIPFSSLYQDEWSPGPRSTPIIDGDRVYVQSCKGEFRCLNLLDGKTLWGVSFEKDFGVNFIGSKGNDSSTGGTASRRGNNGSGVIDGERIFVPVGSTEGASLVCFDKRTGKILWKSQNDEAAYSSLMVGTLAGVRQVIYFSADALMGLEPATGKLLWRVPLKTFAKRHAASPIIFGDSVIVNSVTLGILCTKLSKAGDGLKASQAWVNRDMKINIATPVLVDHYLYCQGPGKEFVCVDAANGKLMWSQDGFGDKYSAALALGKDLLVVTDRGELLMVAADSSKYTQLARLQICGKTWNHPAFADGRLYVREGLNSSWKLTCFNLHAN